jgi:hypothetical protein
MKKLLSLLAILGLAGFVIAPIYAQDEELNLNDEEIVADAEDAAIAEDIAADGEEIALETTDEEAVIE